MLRVLIVFFSTFCMAGSDQWQVITTDVFNPLKRSEVRLASDGTLFVLNYEEAQITHYGKDGEDIATIGEKRTGPGGLMNPDEYFVDDEQVYVLDKQSDTISIFKIDGTFVEMVRPPKRKLTICKVEGGWIYSDFGLARDTGKQGAIYRADLRFEQVEKIMDVKDAGANGGMTFSGEQIVYGGVATYPILTNGPHGKTVYYSEGTRKKIYKIDKSGVSTFATLPYSPVPFNEEWAEARLELFYEGGSNMPPKNKVTRQYPDRFPIIRVLTFTPEGGLWLMRWAGDPDKNKPVVELDKSGKILESKYKAKVLSRLFGFHKDLAYVGVYNAEEDEAGIAIGPKSDMHAYMEAHPINPNGAAFRTISRSNP